MVVYSAVLCTVCVHPSPAALYRELTRGLTATWAVMGCHGLSWAVMGCHGLSATFSAGTDEIGASLFLTTTRKGKRCSTAVAFLDPAKSRPNLTILTNAHVAKVLLEGAEIGPKTATGVVAIVGGVNQTFSASKEVAQTLARHSPTPGPRAFWLPPTLAQYLWRAGVWDTAVPMALCQCSATVRHGLAGK